MKQFLFVLLLVPWLVMAQETDPKFTVKGYIKDMVTLRFPSKDSTLADNLIHNRINFAWYPNDHFKARLELRNRFFTGSLVRNIPNYSSYVDVNNDYFDLSALPINNHKAIALSTIDRAMIQWNYDDWEVTLGRQRINWGVNLIWNPNDLFNTYSFYDFDYEERPGSDALRIRKYTGFASEIEFAIKVADNFKDLTTAMKYQFNVSNYDIQILGGVMKNNLALGTGWAGSIGGMGVKGEMTYLNQLGIGLSQPAKDGFLCSVSFDYSFANSLYLNGSALYNSYGAGQQYYGLVGSTSKRDIRTISPYKWSSLIQATYPVHPLVNLGLATIYFPSDNSVFLNPSVTYSIVKNLDLDLIGQLYYTQQQNAQALFIRVKYSY